MLPRTPQRSNTLPRMKKIQKIRYDHERKLKREPVGNEFQPKLDLSSPFPSNDEARLLQGATAYKHFSGQFNQGEYFREFRVAGRQLGLPFGLIAASRLVEQQINVMQYFMWKNAVKLFPTLAATLPPPSQTIPHPFKVKTESGIETRSLYLASDFVDVVSLLAEELCKFLDYWESVPKFVEEDVSKSATLLRNELEYRVKCFRTSHQPYAEETAQRYLHDLCRTIGPQIATLGRALNDFVEVGAAAVRSAQEHKRLNLRNMSTIATFFSAVTTGMIQISIPNKETFLQKAVNLLFIGSLVMSVAAVIQSILALAWNQASYRAPDDRAPRLLVFWTTHSPLVFMIASTVMFSTGLLGLCAAMLDPITFKVVLALTIFCAVGFLITTIWSIAESLVYRHYKGSKWFRDVLSARWKQTMGLLPFRVALKIWHRILSLAISVWFGIVGTMGRLKASLQHRSANRRTLIPMALNNHWKTVRTWAVGTTTVDSGLEAVHDDERRAVDSETVEVIQVEEKEDAADFWQRPENAEGVLLNAIKTHAHVGAIKHLQFNSPTVGQDNQMLATHSKGLTRVWQLPEDAPSVPLVHLMGLGTTKWSSVCRQYAWGPDGSRVLTRWNAMTRVRSAEGDKGAIRFSERWPSDGCTRWLADGYLSSSEGSIRRLDKTGRVQDEYELKHMSLIHDMELTAGGDRIVAVGETLLRSDLRAVTESAIFLYNMETRNLETIFPLCRRAQTIERSRKTDRSQYFLVSYEDASPQLWTLHLAEATPRLSLTHGYAAASPDTMRYTGPACFGGIDGFEFVLIPTPRAIYVLSTKTGAMQYALHTSVIPGLAAFTSVAWDHSAPSLRLATGSVDGTVVIWTAVCPPSSQAPEDDEPANPGRLLVTEIASNSPLPSDPPTFLESLNDLLAQTRL